MQMARIGDLESALAVIDLYTEDGIWESPQLNARREGKAANLQFSRQLYVDGDAKARGAHRHFVSNVQIDVEDAENATGFAYWMFYQENSSTLGLKEIAMMGQYKDRFRKTAEGWRLARRIVEIAGGALP